MENKEFMDNEIELLDWDEDGIRRLARITIDGLSTEVYVTPDFEDMTLKELNKYLEKLEDKYDDIQDEEPEDEESDEYSDWEDKLEFIEELIAEVEDIIEERS